MWIVDLPTQNLPDLPFKSVGIRTCYVFSCGQNSGRNTLSPCCKWPASGAKKHDDAARIGITNGPIKFDIASPNSEVHLCHIIRILLSSSYQLWWLDGGTCNLEGALRTNCRRLQSLSFQTTNAMSTTRMNGARMITVQLRTACSARGKPGRIRARVNKWISVDWSINFSPKQSIQ